MVTIATRLFGRAEVASTMAEKITSGLNKFAELSIEELEEIEEIAKDKIEKVLASPEFSGAQSHQSLYAIEHGLMDKLAPELKRIADEIVTPLNPQQPSMGYVYVTRDGRRVKAMKSEVWKAMNDALRQLTEPVMAKKKPNVKVSGFDKE